MQIVINGEAREIDPSLTVAELLERLGLEPRRVAIEVNEKLVRRTEYDQTRLHEGDRVEIVTLVGGG